MRKLVFGKGTVGVALSNTFDWIAVDRVMCDVSSKIAVEACLDNFSPDIVINGAAVTNAKLCQQEPSVAERVNLLGAKNIADACKARGIRSVQLSSYAVLDPVNRYAATKLLAEQVGFDLVVRFDYFNSDHWILKGLKKPNDPLSLLKTNKFNPVSLNTLIRLLEILASSQQKGLWGIGSKDCVSNFQFALLARKILGLHTAILNPVSDFDPGYPMPKNTYVDISKLVNLRLDPIVLENEIEGLLNAERS